MKSNSFWGKEKNIYIYRERIFNLNTRPSHRMGLLIPTSASHPPSSGHSGSLCYLTLSVTIFICNGDYCIPKTSKRVPYMLARKGRKKLPGPIVKSFLAFFSVVLLSRFKQLSLKAGKHKKEEHMTNSDKVQEGGHHSKRYYCIGKNQ